VVAAYLWSEGPVTAQEFRSTITGRVMDPQQGAVPGARIVCLNADTGAEYRTISATDGAYTISLLQPGRYAVTAEAPGFKAHLGKDLHLSTNQRVQLDLELEVGPV